MNQDSDILLHHQPPCLGPLTFCYGHIGRNIHIEREFSAVLLVLSLAVLKNKKIFLFIYHSKFMYSGS